MDTNSNQAPLTPPDMNEPAPATDVSQATYTQPQQAQATDVYGIISIVLAVFGLAIIGLIVGIIGMKQAKAEGRSNTVSKVGVIINAIFSVFYLLIFAMFFLFAVGMGGW